MLHGMSLVTYLQVPPRAVSLAGWNWEEKKGIPKLYFCLINDLFIILL